MNINASSSKYKIAFHSWRPFLFTFILFILAIVIAKQSGVRYFSLGLLFTEIIRIVFSKRKYIIAVSENDTAVSVTYLNRMLLKKQTSINLLNLRVTDVTETNWWLGGLDKIIFENDSQHLTFDCINREIRQRVLHELNVV